MVQTVCAHSRKHNSLWCPRGAAGSSFISTFYALKRTWVGYHHTSTTVCFFLVCSVRLDLTAQTGEACKVHTMKASCFSQVNLAEQRVKAALNVITAFLFFTFSGWMDNSSELFQTSADTEGISAV